MTGGKFKFKPKIVYITKFINTEIPMTETYQAPFHYSLTVKNIEETAAFYRDIFQCTSGRSGPNWLDINLYGHMVSFHEDPDFQIHAFYNEVESLKVPIPHFGLCLNMEQYQNLYDRIKRREDIDWIFKDKERFSGTHGGQRDLFLRDPSGNAIEIKGMLNGLDDLFTVADTQ